MPLTDAGRAWQALLDLLRDADQTFLDGPRGEMDALGVAEGYRHLTHLLSYAFDLYLEADAERPAFTALAGPTRKILGDNVDSRYFFAPLRGDRRYRIRGRRGGEDYLAFCVYGGPRAARHQRLHRRGDEIVHRRRQPGVGDPPRHRQADVPQADEAEPR